VGVPQHSTAESKKARETNSNGAEKGELIRNDGRGLLLVGLKWWGWGPKSSSQKLVDRVELPSTHEMRGEKKKRKKSEESTRPRTGGGARNTREA